MVPNYLHAVMPRDQRSVYDLRKKKNIKEPSVNTEVFRRSFFLFSIKLWDSLDETARNTCSVGDLKRKMKYPKNKANILHHNGKRWPAIQHARLRIGYFN